MEKKDVNIMIGRFMPFTLGHDAVLKALYKENGYPCVVCCVSNKKFDSKHPFSDELIKKELDTCLKGEDYYEGQIMVASAAIDKIGAELAKEGYSAHLWGCGTDREKQYQRMASNKKYLADFPEDFKLFVVARDETSSDISGISATKVREAIKTDNKAEFVKMMPDGAQKLFNEFKDQLSKVNESCISLSDYVGNTTIFDID